jgi:hypothetical protein
LNHLVNTNDPIVNNNLIKSQRWAPGFDSDIIHKILHKTVSDQKSEDENLDKLGHTSAMKESYHINSTNSNTLKCLSHLENVNVDHVTKMLESPDPSVHVNLIRRNNLLTHDQIMNSMRKFRGISLDDHPIKHGVKRLLDDGIPDHQIQSKLNQ